MRTEVQSNGAECPPPIFTPSLELNASELVPASVAPFAATATNIILIEKRPLLRECLTRCFEAALGPAIMSFASVEEWLKVMDQTSAAAIVLSIGRRQRHDGSAQREITLVNRAAKDLPIVLLADEEEPSGIAEALKQGVRGYIPTSVSVSIAIEAMRLVRVGGTYVPVSSLIAAGRQDSGASNGESSSGESAFTTRQMAVLKALCRGKPNKIIAYDLNMCESTVKVHVRN